MRTQMLVTKNEELWIDRTIKDYECQDFKWKVILLGCYCISTLVHYVENKVNGNLIKTNKTHLYIEFIKIVYILEISKKTFRK